MTLFSRVVALGFAASLVSLAPAHGQGDTSGETVTSTAPPQNTEDAQKLNQMSQGLKKQCDDLRGTFDLQSVSAKHEPAPLDRNSMGRLGSEKMYGAKAHPNGGTAYQADGQCTTTFTMDFAHPPPNP